MALAGVLRVPQPLHGDTLTFVHGGDVLVHGKLYADFWDIKPPGIFYFTALGGLLFGFHEIGEHLFELLYMTFTAALALFAARTLPGRSRRFGNVAVLLAWVPHYAVGTCFFALQIEGIVGPALLACAFLGLRPEKGARFASGCIAAWIIASKQLFAPLVLAFWWLSIREHGKGRVRETAAPLLAGAGLVAVLLALPFAAQGTLGEVMRTLFVYPVQNFGNTQSKVAVLTTAFWWFGPFFPLLGLALLGAVAPERKRDPMLVCVALWVAMGFAIVFIQRVSLWAYHFQLLTFPIGILAAYAVDWLAGAVPRERMHPWAWRGLVLFLLVPFLGHLVRPLGMMVERGFPRDPAALRAYQEAFDDPHAYYDSVLPEAEFLAAHAAASDEVFVLGNPLIVHLAGRKPQSLRNEPWTPRMWPPSKWVWLDEDYQRLRPELVFVDHDFLEYERGKAFAAKLPVDYESVRRSDSGTWWRRREAAASVAP